MTQKANLFKGQQKRKTIPPNRHGKVPVTRKGKRYVKPSKTTKDMETERNKCSKRGGTLIECLGLEGVLPSRYQEVSKFINYCNETKAATLANKEGGQLSIVKTSSDAGNGSGS